MMTDDLEPVDVETLLAEFSDHTIAELVLEIHELRKKLEQEKKAHAVDEHHRQKAEEKIEELEGVISNAVTVLQNEPAEIQED